MLILSEEARKKYAEFTALAAKEIASGEKDSKLLDLMNLIHDKYKVVQTYPNLGTLADEKEGIRKVPLSGGWNMLYIPLPNCIQVVDFVNEP